MSLKFLFNTVNTCLIDSFFFCMCLFIIWTIKNFVTRCCTVISAGWMSHLEPGCLIEGGFLLRYVPSLWKAWPEMVQWAVYMKIWQINRGTERGLPPLLVIIAMSDAREPISIWNVLGQHSAWWDNPWEFREGIIGVRREETWEQTPRGTEDKNVAGRYKVYIL